mmetsp:Transcript_3364/g.3696  ORF Transcript_3364/g.3696 Transcript_3364/m.3696 type:complete len:282 (+) Transcript_3364:21-866(+)
MALFYDLKHPMPTFCLSNKHQGVVLVQSIDFGINVADCTCYKGRSCPNVKNLLFPPVPLEYAFCGSNNTKQLFVEEVTHAVISKRASNVSLMFQITKINNTRYRNANRFTVNAHGVICNFGRWSVLNVQFCVQQLCAKTGADDFKAHDFRPNGISTSVGRLQERTTACSELHCISWFCKDAARVNKTSFRWMCHPIIKGRAIGSGRFDYVCGFQNQTIERSLRRSFCWSVKWLVVWLAFPSPLLEFSILNAISCVELEMSKFIKFRCYILLWSWLMLVYYL